MTYVDQEKSFAEFTQSMQDTMFRKGNDYGTEDRLFNFKAVATITNTTPELACLNLIATKVARLSVLLNSPNKLPNNESIDDSILDLANYSILLKMIKDDSI